MVIIIRLYPSVIIRLMVNIPNAAIKLSINKYWQVLGIYR